MTGEDDRQSKVDQDLLKRLERLELVLAGTKSGIWDYDIVNDTAYMDKQWKAILGYADHELNNDPEEWRKRWHPDDAEKIKRAVQQCEEGKTDRYEIEHRMLHKDGTYRWISATGKLIYNVKKQPIRAVGSITDITKIKETEARILESENKLKDFARAVPDVSAIVDEDGRYIELFGNDEHLLAGDTIQGKTFHEVFPKEIADIMLDDVQQVILTGKNRSMIRELDIGSVKRYFEGRSAPMNYRVNGKKTVVVVVSDITERLRVDQMLKFTYDLKRKSDFINDILSGNAIYNEDTTALAKDLGISLDKPLYCCLISVCEISNPEQPKMENEPGVKQSAFASAEGEIRCPVEWGVSRIAGEKIPLHEIIQLISTKTKCFVWDNRDKIGVLCQDGIGQDAWEHSMTASSQLNKMLGNVYPELVVSIAISDVHQGRGSIEKSYQEAWKTLLSAQCQVKDKGGIYHYRDIGLFQILTSIYGHEYAAEFVRKTLGPLVEYDSEKGTNLLLTLDEILQSSNLKEAADKLFIHHKTLVFRKQRIEKILEITLDNFDQRLTLAAAIKLYKLNRSNCD